jgi:hypothetical protein
MAATSSLKEVCSLCPKPDLVFRDNRGSIPATIVDQVDRTETRLSRTPAVNNNPTTNTIFSARSRRMVPPLLLAQSAHDKPERLLQFRVFGFGLLQDGDVGVSVFPEGKATHRMPMPARPIALLARARSAQRRQ